MKSQESRGGWKPGESSLDSNITPEFPAEGVGNRSGRIFCVKGKHMLVCGNRWCNEDKCSFRPDYGMEAFLYEKEMEVAKDVQESPCRLEFCSERKRG